MGVMSMNGSQMGLQNQDYVMAGECVTATAEFSGTTNPVQIDSSIDLQCLFILELSAFTIVAENTTYIVDSVTFDPAILFDQKARLEGLHPRGYFPPSGAPGPYVQIDISLTRNNNKIIIAPTLFKVDSRGYGILVRQDSFSGRFVYSTGGGSGGAHGIISIPDSWELFEYTKAIGENELGYTIPYVDTNEEHKLTLKGRDWLPLRLEIDVYFSMSGATMTNVFQFNLRSGQYYQVAGSGMISNLFLNLATATITYTLNAGYDVTAVRGYQWIAIAGHKDYYPDKLILYVNASYNVVAAQPINTQTLMLKQQGYTINTGGHNYRQQPADNLIVSSTNGGYGWDLSGASASAPGNTMGVSYLVRSYQNEVIGTNGIMCPSPYWYNTYPVEAQAVLATDRMRVLAFQKDGTQQAAATTNVPSSFGEFNIFQIRHTTDIVPMPLHYGPLSIVYDPTVNGGWSCTASGAAGEYMGLTDRFLYLRTNISGCQPCICYAYNTEENLKSFLGDSILSNIYAYAARSQHAHYFWVDNTFYACAGNGDTWQIAINSSGGIWGKLPTAFAINNSTQVTVGGVVLRNPDGSAVSCYSNIINGTHYYLQN